MDRKSWQLRKCNPEISWVSVRYIFYLTSRVVSAAWCLSKRPEIFTSHQVHCTRPDQKFQLSSFFNSWCTVRSVRISLMPITCQEDLYTFPFSRVLFWQFPTKYKGFVQISSVIPEGNRWRNCVISFRRDRDLRTSIKGKEVIPLNIIFDM